jgi:UDP-glucose 4-epimerase
MILIIGGSGFLGGRLKSGLIERDIDNINITTSNLDKYTSNLNKQRIVSYLDLQKRPDSISFDFLENVDTIINLASLNASDSFNHPKAARDIKITGTRALIEAAIKYKIKKFINISTCHVYGSGLRGVINENSSLNPEGVYSLLHLEAEKLLEEYICDETNIINLRLANGVGSPVEKNVNCWSLLVNDLCRQATVRKSITLKSPRIIKRDFVPIEFFIDVIYWFLINDLTGLKYHNYNIASSIPRSLEFVTSLIKLRYELLFNESVRVIFQNNKKDQDINNFIISNNRIIDLGIKGNFDLTNEIDRLLINCNEWFK